MSDQLSIIVPARLEAGSIRERNWRWLSEYWAAELPDVDVVIGRSYGDVFSKTQAVNYGARRAEGRILAIVDADCYIPGAVIQQCADDLDESLARGIPRWFIPYTALFRLTETATEAALATDPADPWRLPADPEAAGLVESTLGSLHGRRYGALITIVPREGFQLLGGMDPRFRGWGGEDISFARALDTLYARHKTTANDVAHFWHPKIGPDYLSRTWAGQADGGERANGDLASRYNHATDDRVMMRDLVDEGIDYGREQQREARRNGWPLWPWR